VLVILFLGNNYVPKILLFMINIDVMLFRDAIMEYIQFQKKKKIYIPNHEK
jgi:hypothetical protein